ncbi:MAG: RecX family transcriptional regulator [Phycisphaerales bacterium]|nr:RecX family transcriptional regulator [Phycisphaerales bacterium]
MRSRERATRRAEPADPAELLPPDAAVLAVKPSPRDPARVTVRADGGASWTLDALDAASMGLRPGVIVTPALAAALRDAADFDAARRYALRSIEHRACSRARLLEKLARRGYSPEVARRVADRLQAAGLIDDRLLAESLARSEVARKPAGRFLIEQKLRRRGIDSGLARGAAALVLASRDPLEDALDLARRRARTFPAKLEADARRRRLYGALARRGFDPEVCARAVERVLAKDPGKRGERA